jgi:hypothetical protein
VELDPFDLIDEPRIGLHQGVDDLFGLCVALQSTSAGDMDEGVLELDPSDLEDDREHIDSGRFELAILQPSEGVARERHECDCAREPKSIDRVEWSFEEPRLRRESESCATRGGTSQFAAITSDSDDAFSVSTSTHYSGCEKLLSTSYSSIDQLAGQFSIEPLWSDQELSRGLRVVAGLEAPPRERGARPLSEDDADERPEQLEPTRRLGPLRKTSVGA